MQISYRITNESSTKIAKVIMVFVDSLLHYAVQSYPAQCTITNQYYLLLTSITYHKTACYKSHIKIRKHYNFTIFFSNKTI